MKRCPDCRRDYFDDSLLYCLEDGAALIQGAVPSPDEPATAIIRDTVPPGDANTGSEIRTTDPTTVFPSGIVAVNKNGADKRIPVYALAVIVILAGGFFGYRYFKPAASEQVNSIAVLPFENRSGSADTDYLSDGLADSLIYRLSQLPNLKVSPTSSVMRYKGKDADVAQIAGELKVDAVMSGRLVQRNDDLSVSVQLIDARSGKVIWAEQYDRKIADLLATQREIATMITQKLQLKFSGDEATGITKKYTDNNEAYQLYLKGRFYGMRRTAKDAQQAIDYYQHAVDLDPNFALAFAGLSEANWFLFLYSYPQVEAAVPKARELALKAIKLDPTLAEPHSVLGIICASYDSDFACDEREQKRAIELNPNYTEGHRRYGLLLTNLGRFDEADAAIKRALEIDPLSPVANEQLANLLFNERKYEESEKLSKKELDLDPNYWYAHWQLFNVYRMKRDYGSTVEELARVQESRGEPDAAKFIRESFQSSDWPSFLKTITADRSRLKLYPYFVATFFAELGQKDKAFALLNEALETKDQHIASMKVDPFMDPLRDDPRFKDVLRRTGLPE